jgi:hypothetical protein
MSGRGRASAKEAGQPMQIESFPGVEDELTEWVVVGVIHLAKVRPGEAVRR